MTEHSTRTPSVLQPGCVEPGRTYLSAMPEHVLWGRLPRAGDRPVLTVDPGAVVVVDTVSHEGILEDQGRDPVAYFAARGVDPQDVLLDAVEIARTVAHDPDVDGPHVLTGPIAVRGARPGDVLSVKVLDLQPRAPYGIVSNRHGRGALPGELPEGPGPTSVFCTVGESPDGLLCRMGTADDGLSGPALRFPARMFLGIMGVAPAGDVRLDSVPPGDHGGNLDVSLLGTGSTLHLPVHVDDALFYVGDPHVAQGDGEVALTAFEAPLRATLKLDLIPAERAVRGRDGRPLLYGETDEVVVPIGLDVDLAEAMRACVRQALDLLEQLYGLDRGTAYAYLSAATDFSVSQVVDRVTGVHAAIRKVDFLEVQTSAVAPATGEEDRG